MSIRDIKGENTLSVSVDGTYKSLQDIHYIWDTKVQLYLLNLKFQLSFMICSIVGIWMNCIYTYVTRVLGTTTKEETWREETKA